MKIKEGFAVRDIAGTQVVVPLAENLVALSKMITLSETGAFIWKALSESELNKDELLQMILDEYEVTEDLASRDLDNFISSLRKANVLDEG